MQIIPKDLKTLILEFLPFTEYPKLRLVCQDFCVILDTTPRLWAKQIFSQYLDPRGEKLDMFELELYEERPPIAEDGLDFDRMKDAPELLKSHFAIKEKCKQFLEIFLQPGDCKQLVSHVFSSFTSPNYPVPTLKKDIHFFPTNTLFQNFLTETYFGLLNKPCPNDGRQAMVSDIMKFIEKSLVDNQLPTGRLVSLRWYLFDSFTKEGRSDADLLSGLYEIIYKMAKNYCEMVFACLKVVKRSEDLLSEYIRLWNGYVITTIEVNRIFLPFSNFLNKIYKSNCQGFPNFPEFSIWRIMVKVWLNEVYGPISPKVHQAFRVALMSLRTQESSFDFFEPSPSLEEGENQSYQILTDFYGAKRLEPEAETDRDEKFRLLREVYQGLCDLSYDEFTIFYWNCAPVKHDTPKGVLDSMIIQDTCQLYECCKRFLFGYSKEISEFLKTDVELMESLFEKELSSKSQEGQVLAIKDFLTEFFNSMTKKTEFEEFYCKCFDEDIEEKSSGVNFGAISKLLDPQNIMKEKIGTDKKFRLALSQVLGKKSSQFNFFLNLLENITEEIERDYQERDEILRETMEKGFIQVDEKFESFFSLNKNPSYTHLLTLSEEEGSNQLSFEYGKKFENLMI